MLYPLLGFGTTEPRPKQTYLAYYDEVEIEEEKLVCAYEREYSDHYVLYRDNVIKTHPKFLRMIQDDNFDYFIFDLSEFSEDFQYFLKGEYSKFSRRVKDLIISHYGQTKVGPIMIDMHLNPENYHEFFAQEFGSDIESWKQAHETLQAPDIDKEIT